jgi:amino acid adenylation domain-containing protein
MEAERTMLDVLALCSAHGIGLEEVDGKLRIRFDGATPSSEVLDALRTHKAGLLTAIRARAPVLRTGPRSRTRATAAQRRLWLIARLDGGGSAYNMVGAFRLSGSLDASALRDALDDVVAQHSALRTRFVEEDGEVWQVVDEAACLAWNTSDVRGDSVSDAQAHIEALLRLENGWHFELSKGPLLRASLMRLADDSWVMAITLHHINADGWSLELIQRQLADAYAARRRGVAWALPACDIQYTDHAVGDEAGAPDAAQLARIQVRAARLDGMPTLHSLPLDRPRPPVQTFSGEKFRVTIDAERLAAMRRQCQAHDATLFMYLQAAFSATIALYGNEHDVVTGFPEAGRSRHELHATVGLFVNTLVLRQKIHGNPSFGEWLAQTKVAVLETLRDGDLPYEALVDVLRPERSRAYGPLVQVMFVLQPPSDAGLALSDLTVTPLYNAHEPSKFDLQVIAEPSGHVLHLYWQFNPDLFERATIGHMADAFDRLIERALTDDATAIFSVPFDSGLVGARGASDRTVLRLDEAFEAAAALHPDRRAVIFEDECLTYGEVDRQANALAAVLRDEGVRRGANVAICMHRSVEMIVAMLAVLKAGAAYVPMDPSHPQARLEAVLADCRARVVVTDASMASLFDDRERAILVLDEHPVASGSVVPSERGDASDPAYVIYTSGTTGEPKGVVVGHAGILSLLAHFDGLAPLHAPWNGSLWCSTSFDVAVYEVFSALCGGGTLHIVPDRLRLEPDALFRWIEARAIHSLYMHAGYLEPLGRFVRDDNAGHALRRMLVGVEPIPSEHLHVIAHSLPRLTILNGYGPTETTVCCTIHAFDDAAFRRNARVPIGRPVRDTHLEILNASGAPVPVGAVGELHIAGIGLAHGYLGRADLTADRFVTIPSLGGRRFYRTGDLVRLRPDGELEFLGRKDSQVKLRGFRIELGEIEVRLCELAGVSDAVVRVVDESTPRLVAYVVPSMATRAVGLEGFAAGLKRMLRLSLPEYMVPAEIMVLDALPLTTNGKVDFRALPKSSERPPSSAVAPRNMIEERLVSIWADVLGVESVSVTDDFFAVGGQSITANRMLNRIRLAFGLPDDALSLGDVFGNPDVEHLALAVEAVIDRERTRSKEATLHAMEDAFDEGVI